MARADIISNPGGSTDVMRRGSQSAYSVEVAGVIYHFWVDFGGSDLWWNKSTDGGLTWTTMVTVKAGSVDSFSVWYDKWTPGDTGTKIHLAYIEDGADDVFYRALDTADDTLGTETTIFAGLSVVSGVNTCTGLTKAIGGNLYCAFDIDGGTEVGFYFSNDAGATWGVKADVNEAPGTDYYLLAPGFGADTNDIICIYWDRSASEISRKLYDVSLDSWAETSIATSMTAPTTSTNTPNFAITVDDPNNKILLVAWTATDLANADLRFWSIDESSITEGTNVVLNSTDDQGMCAITMNILGSRLTVFYGGKSDGSETFPTAINIYYKESTDGGTTWGAETKLSQITRSYAALWTSILYSIKFIAHYHEQLTAGAGNQDPEYMSVVVPSQRARYQMGVI